MSTIETLIRQNEVDLPFISDEHHCRVVPLETLRRLREEIDFGLNHNDCNPARKSLMSALRTIDGMINAK